MSCTETYDWEADNMATATLAPEPQPKADRPVSRTLDVPLPPSLPAGATFTGYSVEGRRYSDDAETLAGAVDMWLDEGIGCELSASASKVEYGPAGEYLGEWMFRTVFRTDGKVRPVKATDMGVWTEWKAD